jgi:hypothetical protein
MGCNTCGHATFNTNTISDFYQQQPVGNCGFNRDILLDWRDKLICIRDANKMLDVGITRTQLNSMLGTVLSGLNLDLNICFLEDKLEQIEPTISQITILGIC